MALCSYEVNPADVGTRGLTVEELASADLWWNGTEFLKKLKQDWPECKFDKPTSTENLELKGTKQTGTKDATSYQTIEEGEENTRVEEVQGLDPLKILEMVCIESKQKEDWKLGCVKFV